LKKHFLFVNQHRCEAGEELKEKCIKTGREEFVQFDHISKRMRQRAFYCMGGCATDVSCIEGCHTDLRAKFTGLVDPMLGGMDEYLANFKTES
jgi:hypothetical protein